MTLPSRFYILFCISLLLLGMACQRPAEQPQTAQPEQQDFYQNPAIPEWSYNANIYEVNLRQYTLEGTIKAFAQHLPRLRDMGVDILWFMPIHPISKAKRKGPLGSYYAVSDYRAVNPNFGTKAEFQALIDTIHAMDMRIILDWVPNHTGWDHPWITEHPDYYTQNDQGEIIDPVNPETGESWGWTDVADLNYNNPKMRRAMIADMKYWLTEHNIDGYRVDVAHGVPHDFWQQSIPQLRTVDEDVFLLAEAEIPRLRNDSLYAMTYGWSFHHILNGIARGEKDANAIQEWIEADRDSFHTGYHMHFITNHDENSWAGTVQQRMGPAADALAVLAFTFQGMPLIYSGQEAAMDKQLKFFEKDPIEWGDFEKADFYSTLLALKHDNQALWNGPAGAELQRLSSSKDAAIYAFVREKNGNRVIVMLNLSAEQHEVELDTSGLEGAYADAFSQAEEEVTSTTKTTMKPWEYRVLVGS